MVKFYAVKNGRETGIFNSWEECQKQIKGFSGAQFKSFSTKKEAEDYLVDKIKEVEDIFEVDGVYAYIDGSFDREKGIYGSGVVIVDGENHHEYKHADNKEEYAELHNVAGEIEAAKFVMWYAANNKIPEITIFYDYQGIECWATGEWKTNLDYTKNYKKFAEKVAIRVKVNFVKVKAHTGVELNERVDTLAKQAIEEFRNKER